MQRERALELAYIPQDKVKEKPDRQKGSLWSKSPVAHCIMTARPKGYCFMAALVHTKESPQQTRNKALVGFCQPMEVSDHGVRENLSAFGGPAPVPSDPFIPAPSVLKATLHKQLTNTFMVASLWLYLPRKQHVNQYVAVLSYCINFYFLTCFSNKASCQLHIQSQLALSMGYRNPVKCSAPHNIGAVEVGKIF